MNKKITLGVSKLFLGMIFISQGFYSIAQEEVHKLKEKNSPEGYRIQKQDDRGLIVEYSMNQYSVITKDINSDKLHTLSVSGMLLQNEEGFPDLPQSGRYIAIPQGATAVLKVLSFNIETIKNINMAPAPRIPMATDDEPLVYKRENAIYLMNEFFPENPVKLFEQTQIRGVDVVMLGMSPFQYNPVSKDLIVYKDIKVEISFVGGNGHFGEDAYRSRYWEPILSDMILNYSQLPEVDMNAQIRKNNNKISADIGCEYAIIIPNAPEFAQWADSIKKFRTEQGILTHVYTLTDIGGNTDALIQTFVSDAYNNWTVKPAAMLILADYGTSSTSSVIAHKYTHMGGFPDFASDNFYADVTGDDLPDIVFSRIVANNAAQLQVMCTKFLNYERNPPTDASFYNKPLIALGWQDDRWFQLCGEIVGGFMKSIGKNQTRVCDLGSPAVNTGNNVPNTGNWSTNSNTTTILNYFGPTGLNYVPAQPGTLGGFSGGTATAVNTAINNGAFLALHRDHGYYQGWGDPAYSNSSISSLTNVGNKLPFVFSINCQTGAYHHTSECFVEKMHRYTKNGQNSGALGMIGDAETSYSFVNDCMVWGMFDNMWPAFMPAYGTNPASMSRDKRPAFANVSAKYFLKQSSWASVGTKQITFQLYHMFGDAFQWFYSEVPKPLNVVHNNKIGTTDNNFTVSADAGSFIALTIPGASGPIIIGTGVGTGAAISIPLSQNVTTSMLVTVTKQDYFRYGKNVTIGTATSINNYLSSNELNFSCFPNPVNQSTTISYVLDISGMVKLSLVDMLGKEVAVIIDNANQAAGAHQVQFDVNELPKGVYSCVLKTDSKVATQNLVVKE